MEEITLEIQWVRDYTIRCFPTFRSSDAIALQLEFHIADNEVGEELLGTWIGRFSLRPSRPSMVTPYYPISNDFVSTIVQLHRMTIICKRSGNFSSLGPLNGLTVHGCDPRILLTDFSDEVNDSEQTVKFPQVKELKTLHPWTEYDGT